MTGPSVLAVGSAQAAPMSALHGQCFEEAWDEAAFQSLLGMPGSLAYLASRAPGSPPEGFLLARAAGGEAEIITIGVLPAARGAGLAKALVAALRTGLTNCDQIFLEVAEDNQSAIGLYEGLGFDTVGRRENYYQRSSGPPMSARIMRLSLG